MAVLKKVWNFLLNLDVKKRAYLALAIVFLGIMSWAFISAGIITCKFNREQLTKNIDAQKVDAVGIIITETKDSAKYFEIYGETGKYNNQDNLATLYNLVGNFYKDNKVSMSFQSTKGTYNERTKVITLYEDTLIALNDGTSLSADNIVWSGSNRETVAKGNVKIKKGHELYAVADACIIGSGYDKFKILGKTETKLYSNKEMK